MHAKIEADAAAAAAAAAAAEQHDDVDDDDADEVDQGATSPAAAAVHAARSSPSGDSFATDKQLDDVDKRGSRLQLSMSGLHDQLSVASVIHSPAADYVTLPTVRLLAILSVACLLLTF